MTNTNFSYHFTSAKTPGEIYNLLLDVRQWWSGFFEETINGKSGKVNDEFSFLAGGGMHYTEQKLVELVPNEKVVWQVTESKLSFLEEPGEWKGTRFGFVLAPEKKGTKVTFTHEGLVPEIECFDQCSAGWTQYLGQLEKNLS
jgi:hypothetical protein